ncbi:hypothetical protein FZC84_11970 [Rossellomorea vietnamensis]|uniref:Phage protein n=1 Tax=Rossellomorea vietnamensis TaxID=218284 RepID=A0A5D4MBS7_9BACI|nr:hypothetical protein [Rossellomorea vietnamensis]TYR99086.1 hypothetical protein FZC84_11970 [Rossellomorea vietnamensis]
MKDFKEQLKEWKQQHREVKGHGQKKPKKRREEVLSESDIKSLMGMNRARYCRGKGGAIRQK